MKRSHLDKGYEHTEFELLRKLYGDDDAFNSMLEKVTQENIKKRIEAAQEKILA